MQRHELTLSMSPMSSRSFSTNRRIPQDHNHEEARRRRMQAEKNKTIGIYLTAVALATLGLSYAFVPLYRIFCQVTGYGGTVQIDETAAKLQAIQAGGNNKKLRKIRIKFDTTMDRELGWDFYPCQQDVEIRIGETCLAFFTAKNNRDKAQVGVATYNVVPMRAGLYFNKIQCFCFDEQRLRANEEVDMPVFFFVDPKMDDDPFMDSCETILLSYTFYPAHGYDDDEEDEEGATPIRPYYEMNPDGGHLPPKVVPPSNLPNPS